MVENILEDIYPDAAYLSTFNASQISVVELVRLIPNLLSYSRYSQERYQEVFDKYQNVLVRLVEILNSTGLRIREEAVAYNRLTSIFMNQTLILMNQTLSGSENVNALIDNQGVQQSKLSESQIRELLKVQYNITLGAAEKLYESLEKFQLGVMAEAQNNTDIYRLSLPQCKIEGAAEVQQLLEGVSSSSVQVWDSLVNYGFWLITSSLTSPSGVQEVVPTTTEKVISKPRIFLKNNL